MKADGIPTWMILLLLTQLGGCQREHADTALPAIDWRTSPLDLNLRGMNGMAYLFRCPVGKPAPEAVTGSDVYTDASSICAAAAHAGEVEPGRGGLVMIRILPGQTGYRGTMRNFIPSQGYAQAWGGSFAVLLPARFHADKPK